MITIHIILKIKRLIMKSREKCNYYRCLGTEVDVSQLTTLIYDQVLRLERKQTILDLNHLPFRFALITLWNSRRQIKRNNSDITHDA